MDIGNFNFDSWIYSGTQSAVSLKMLIFDDYSQTKITGFFLYISKEEGKDQESEKSSTTTPDTILDSDKNIRKHPRGQPFPSRRTQGS